MRRQDVFFVISISIIYCKLNYVSGGKEATYDANDVANLGPRHRAAIERIERENPVGTVYSIRINGKTVYGKVGDGFGKPEHEAQINAVTNLLDGFGSGSSGGINPHIQNLVNSIMDSHLNGPGTEGQSSKGSPNRPTLNDVFFPGVFPSPIPAWGSRPTNPFQLSSPIFQSSTTITTRPFTTQSRPPRPTQTQSFGGLPPSQRPKPPIPRPSFDTTQSRPPPQAQTQSFGGLPPSQRPQPPIPRPSLDTTQSRPPPQAQAESFGGLPPSQRPQPPSPRPSLDTTQSHPPPQAQTESFEGSSESSETSQPPSPPPPQPPQPPQPQDPSGQILKSKTFPPFNSELGTQLAQDLAQAIIEGFRQKTMATGRLSFNTLSIIQNCRQVVATKHELLRKMKQADGTLLYILRIFYDKLADELVSFSRRSIQKSSGDMRKILKVHSDCVAHKLIFLRV